MALSMEKISENKVKLRIEVDAQAFENGLEIAYRKTRNNYRAPGFRKGRVPRKVIESHYGDSVFFEDAFKELMPDAYQAAVKELEIEPVEQPSISIENIGRHEALVFTAEVHVMPEVTLGQYKGIEVEKVVYNVTDAEVQAEVDKALEKAARYVEADRAVQEGDRVVLDYKGAFDGVEFEGGSAENTTLDIGSKMFIAGFEEQIVGMKKDEQKDIEVTFPEDYPSKEHAGRNAVFHVTVHEVKEKELPAFDDEFVKDVSEEFDTVEEYLADIRRRLAEQGEREAKAKMEDAAVRKVVENATADIPDCMVEDQLDAMLQDMRMNLMRSGIRLEDFFEYSKSSEEDYRKRYRDEAKTRVKTRLVFQALREKEGIAAAEEDVEEKIAKMAESRKLDAKEYREMMKPGDLEYLRDTIAIDKTIDLIMDSAVCVDPGPEPESEAEEGTETAAE
ncbi:MAG: trigger factor [Christensenellales bacterium]|jgi:trigger factor